jgi:hypothetical protein
LASQSVPFLDRISDSIELMVTLEQRYDEDWEAGSLNVAGLGGAEYFAERRI